MAYRLVSHKALVISGATAYSELYNLLAGKTFSLHYVFTLGTGSGMLQYSNDGVTWVDITDTSITFTVGTGSAMWDVLETGSAAVRVKFTSASGMTGTMYACGGGPV
jgi:hypothetical protein